MPPFTQRPIASPVSSRRLLGSEKNICAVTEKIRESRKPSMSGCRKSGSTRISLFSRTTMSFLAALTAAFEPPPKPRLRPISSTRTEGNSRARNSTVPSSDALSTTRISWFGCAAAALTTDGRLRARCSFPFQVGITTVAAPCATGRGAGERFLRRKPASPSGTNSSAAIAGNRTGTTTRRKANSAKVRIQARSLVMLQPEPRPRCRRGGHWRAPDRADGCSRKLPCRCRPSGRRGRCRSSRTPRIP